MSLKIVSKSLCFDIFSKTSLTFALDALNVNLELGLEFLYLSKSLIKLSISDVVNSVDLTLSF